MKKNYTEPSTIILRGVAAILGVVVITCAGLVGYGMYRAPIVRQQYEKELAQWQEEQDAAAAEATEAAARRREQREREAAQAKAEREAAKVAEAEAAQESVPEAEPVSAPEMEIGAANASRCHWVYGMKRTEEEWRAWWCTEHIPIKGLDC